MANPISTVKDKFGDKAKLVAELEKFTKDGDLWVSRLNASKGLAHVSNTKLLRLHATFTAVKAKFGSRAKLIDAIAEAEKRAKDDGFKTHLGAFPVPRLWDLYNSVTKRTADKAKADAYRAAPKSAKKAPAPKKAAVAAPKKAVDPKKAAAAKKKKKK
jgi:hypothetical protein